MLVAFGRRSSNASSTAAGGGGGADSTAGAGGGGADSTTGAGGGIDYGYGELSGGSSSSDWPDDASDKESLQSWAKEQQAKEAKEDDIFANKEEEHLRRWFIFITVVLVLAGIGVCVFTYFYLTGQQQESFETTFANTAQAIVDGTDFHMQVIERSLLAQSQALTTFAVFTGSLWPYVSFPDFAIQGHNFLLETKTEMIAWGPLVTSDPSLRAWEAYSTYMLKNSGWFPSDEKEEQLQKQIQRLEEQAIERSKNGHDTFESGLYIPLWQISPWLYRNFIAHNLTEQFEEPIELLLETKRPVWSRYLDMTNASIAADNDNLYQNDTTINTTATTSSSNSSSPVHVSLLFQPVFRSLPSHDYIPFNSIKNITAAQQDVVGIYLAAVRWDSLLTEIVPKGTPDVHVVLQNPWGETLTYQVKNTGEEGPTTSFLVGKGDQHLSSYDDLSKSTNITNGIVQERESTLEPPAATMARHPHTLEEWVAAGYNASDYSAHMGEQPPDTTYTNFEMTIYPTTNFENAYTSNEPMVFTLILAALVFVAIAVFFWYSRSVHMRQQRLIETANRTALIVKSLFPANVRDRIMKEAEESALKSKAKQKRAKEKEKSALDGSTSERGDGVNTGGGGGSILGGISIGSTGSRGSRYSRRGSVDNNPHRSGSTEFMQASRNNSMGAQNPYGSKPIADHFSETTVMFADMVGFTAWSSVREPTQVFTLLETIYHAFDKVAKKRGIFKVETIGDCYVAVCGLPVPRPDHAIAMSYFANDCLRKMNSLTKKLEVSLGPDTGDLSIRVGLHSGPVTAGVLRGEKSRFQLFGDTVNTAARMESNGMKDCIHVSDATAKLLMDSGKARWLTPRNEKIVAKGKGEMQTYWLEVRSLSSHYESPGKDGSAPMDRRSSNDTRTDDEGSESTNDLVPTWEKDVSFTRRTPVLGERFQRLVDWNVDQLVSLLKKVVAKRNEREALLAESKKDRQQTDDNDTNDNETKPKPKGSDYELRTDTSILQEVTDCITFPKPGVVDIVVGDIKSKSSNVQLDSKVVAQLHELTTTIATLYNDNPFHSFAHASHVAMALITWLSRITSPTTTDDDNLYADKLTGDWKDSTLRKELYALQMDPLTHFALLFAALIHDLDHTGVPNSQLVKEKSQVAMLYNGKSIHEQESVDSAFETLMEDKYADLRNVLFTTEDEFYRFRQIVINCVMATDILSEKVMARQSVRWGCLFRDHADDASYSDYEPENEGDLKTSIILERLLLVSDIAHTMQHWYVYRKWNEKLFEEMYLAFKAGRADADPSNTWYEDELAFFDKFVIPLASQMKDCELFDSSSDEYLSYAINNRAQWETSGKEEVASMLERIKEIEFEVEDNFDPIPDGKVFSPANARPSLSTVPPAPAAAVAVAAASPGRSRPSGGRPNPKDWKKTMDVSKASFDTVFSTRK